MSDVTQRLLAALEALERETDDRCAGGIGGHRVDYYGRCWTCFGERLRLAIAQRIIDALDAAHYEWHINTGDNLDESATDAAVAVFASPGREREDTP